MHARIGSWIWFKATGGMLLWMTVATVGSLALAQRASAMSVQTAPEAGFSIVFDLDFMDNVLRVTLPKSADGVLDAMTPSGAADVLTLSHPLDTLTQVAVAFVPGSGVRVRFDSAGLPSGGDAPSTPGGGSGTPTPPSGSVPEPGSAALLAMGLFGAWTRVRRRAVSA